MKTCHPNASCHNCLRCWTANIMNTERLGPLLEGETRQGQVMGLAQHIQSLPALPLERCEFLTALIIRAVRGNADAMQRFSALATCFRPRRSTTSIPSGTASAGGGAKSTSDYRTGCNGAASGLAACVWFTFALWPWSCMAMNRLREMCMSLKRFNAFSSCQ